MAARHKEKGSPAHDAERRGFRALIAALPASYTVYTNIDLPTGHRAGQTYEHDAIVVAPHAVFTVELKSWGGVITGNRDRWTLADGAPRQSPIPLVLAKARALKGQLQARRRDLGSLWVQGLVFLTAGDAAPHLSRDFEDLVVTLRDVGQALSDPAWLGNPAPLTAQQRRAIEDFLDDGSAPQHTLRLGDLELLERLPLDDRPYEAWLAQSTSLNGERRVLHVYTLAGDSKTERERLTAHALREATLHRKLAGGPDVLRYLTHFEVDGDPHRIVLQFEDTSPLLPSTAWVKDKSPGLAARLKVAARAARALAFVHSQGWVHRRLSPDAILVSPEESPSQVRLCAFDLARDTTGVAPTLTGSSLGDPTFRCVAPEVLRTSEATPRSDVFSLGASLVELFTTRPLFQSVDEVLQPFTVPPLLVGDRPVPRRLADLVERMLAPVPQERIATAEEVAELLELTLAESTRAPRQREFVPGHTLRDIYELVERLGHGATSTTWRAKQLQTGDDVVLKIADSSHAALLQEEGRVLGSVSHPHLVRFYNVEPLPDGNMLVLGYAPGVTARLWIEAGDPLGVEAFLRVADGLLGALDALHAAGYLHRDVKPENLILTEPELRPTLLDAGLAGRIGQTGDLAVGTVRYKDPLVYARGGWTPTNDLFSAFLVLYELLTGAHPFGGAAPEPGDRPLISPDEFPDPFAPYADRLASVFTRALSPHGEERPPTLPRALAEITAALSASPSAPAVAPSDDSRPAVFPEDATPDTLLSTLPLSTRGLGALSRMGRRTVRELAGLDPRAARNLPNVGGKTVRELAAWVEAASARWPELFLSLTTTPPRIVERFYPPLIGDPRPIDELGRALTRGLAVALEGVGLRTVGDLAAAHPDFLLDLPGVGEEKARRLRAALSTLAGRSEEADSLPALQEALRRELGPRPYAFLSLALGLEDGVPHTQAEVAEALGLTRQRISQAVDLEPLRKDASAAHVLRTHVAEVLPAVGFAPLGDVAAGLAVRLPGVEGGASHLGFARLGVLLLRPEARAADARELRLALRPPWTEAAVTTLVERLQRDISWPPAPRASVALALWDALPEDVASAVSRWGGSPETLLDALLRLQEGVRVDRLGGLYRPPVPFSEALSLLRPLLEPLASTETLLAEVSRCWAGVETPEDLPSAIAAAGYRPHGALWADPSRVEAASLRVTPTVDATIPRQRVVGIDVPPVVEALASQVDRGGFRVVALPPGEHHLLGARLAGWLGEAAGADRVTLLRVDRLLLDALKASDLWKFVPFLEGAPAPDWRMFHAELRAALDTTLDHAAPGTLTVLAEPSLLGTLGLMDWLSGFYERARGGRHGLVVLAVPGGIHDDRVRLNERYNLPYTPDMAAVYLEMPPSEA